MTGDRLPPLREVIRAHGLSAQRGLGQNFILDLNLTRRIARLAGDLEGRTVIEVGPGPGGLTRALLAEGARQVIAVERDARCLPALDEIGRFYPGRLVVHELDALTVDFASLAAPPVSVVANLPYGIATALLVGWLSVEPWPPWFDGLWLMFQKEVAERITAAPGNKSYGRLAVLAGWRCEARIRLTLPPGAFTPAPKVSSAVVELIPRPRPLAPCRVADLATVTAAAFGQRRKMLRTSLKQLVADPIALLGAAGIAPELRAEQVPVEGFCQLAEMYRDGR